MRKTDILLILVIISSTQLQATGFACKTDSASASEKKIYFTIRYGQGGFKDERSPIDKLGGGQLALDIKPGKLPLALTISTEYYTNSADPTNTYEISGLVAVNCSYSKYLLKSQRLNVFAGAGLGRLIVPHGTDASTKGMLFDIEAGFNMRLLWNFGLYGAYKYLYADKEKLINFSEHIILVGISFTFGL
ncbi:MAG: hypothetical protein KAR19_01275 [Bacteroidales bacterium]|nr:hypothetical protein [Bacteroidales bacterium]